MICQTIIQDKHLIIPAGSFPLAHNAGHSTSSSAYLHLVCTCTYVHMDDHFNMLPSFPPMFPLFSFPLLIILPFLLCYPGVSACPAEVDEVWQIDWPYTRVNEDAVVPCGVDFVGTCTCMLVHS